jgi:uncharacterized protein YqhQ
VIVLKNVAEGSRSLESHTIMYNYCANQYLRGLYSLSSSEVISIAALKMQSELYDEEEYHF